MGDGHISFVSVCSFDSLDRLEHRLEPIHASLATIDVVRWFLQSGSFPDDIVWYDTSQLRVSARELGQLS